MRNKDLENLSLGLCLMVFNFDLIIFTSIAAIGAFLVFQFANKYDNKSLKLFSLLSIVTIVVPFMLVRFANIPMILLLNVFLNGVSVYALVNVFKISIGILSDFQDEIITKDRLNKDMKMIATTDVFYLVTVFIPLLAYMLNIPSLLNLSNLLIRSDVATAILFVCLVFKYIWSRSYRDLNTTIREQKNNA